MLDSSYLKISIVTPNYNGARYLEETINSVLDQNYPNLEYIIIDGGSTDGSVEIIKKYSKYLKYWVSEPDRGHGDALNKGFAQSTGEVMGWINSDDFYFKDTFRILNQVFSQYREVKWLSGIVSEADVYSRTVKAEERWINIYDYLLGNYEWIQQESTFWRRSLWERAGGRISEAVIMVDGELWCRFFQLAELYYVRAPLGAFRHHSEEQRSSKFRSNCIAEMDQFIVELRKNVDPRVFQRAKQIAQARILYQQLFKHSGSLRKLFFNKLYKDLLDATAYPVLVSRGDNLWKLEKKRIKVE